MIGLETLNICMISTESLPTPPIGYWGGIESVVWDLTTELDRMGHEVSLIARPGSISPKNGKLIETFPDIPDELGVNERHFNAYKDYVTSFDGIVHDHSLGKQIRTFKPYFVQTPHYRQHPQDMGYTNIISPSNALAGWIVEHTPQDQRRDIPVVHHGVDVDRFEYNPDESDYYLYFSYIAKYKGALDALNIAKYTGVNMVFAGIEGDATQDVHDEHCRSNNVTFEGQVSNEERKDLMSNAKALIFPTGSFGTVDWMEIFGLVQIEALASGTPVISSNNGACPEIIEHGKTGFICSSYQEMLEIVRSDAVSTINRSDCRLSVESYFSSKRMSEEYINIYMKILNGELL